MSRLIWSKGVITRVVLKTLTADAQGVSREVANCSLPVTLNVRNRYLTLISDAQRVSREVAIHSLPVARNVGNRCLPVIGCRYKSTTAANLRKPNKRPEIQRPTEIILDGEITVEELAKKMGRPARALMKIMRDVGAEIDKGPKTVLDLDTAEFILLEFDITPVFPDHDESTEDVITRLHSSTQHSLIPRPPVVTIMGHVDHGKTTLLDNLRKASVAAHEAGGITQHIGAFSVGLPSGRQITFIDTPGHAAFNEMRSRGAKLTDVVVLVVAANDGVQSQTLECISHIKAADVPVVVAINKIDKPNSNVSAIKTDVLKHGLHLEEFGGDVAAVEISALKGLHLDKLEETIVLQADLLDLKAEKEGYAQGIILEAQKHKQRGLTSTVLVQKGALKKGSSIIAGNAFAKVRQMFDDKGKAVDEAAPSQPVQVIGWRDLPSLGDPVYEVENEDMAKQLIRMRQLKQRNHLHRKPHLKTFEGDTPNQDENRPTGRRGHLVPWRILHRQGAASGKRADDSSEKKKLEIIVKEHLLNDCQKEIFFEYGKYFSEGWASLYHLRTIQQKCLFTVKLPESQHQQKLADYSGSLEAVLGILNSFKSDKLELSVIHSGVGPIGERDLLIAEAINGTIYGFNVTPSKDIVALSKQNNVSIKSHAVIYNLLDDIKDELASLLPPIYEETYIGKANVLQMFRLTGKKKAVVAGCRVKEGSLARGKDIVYKVLRSGEIKHEGRIEALKHGQNDIDIARNDSECGICLEQFKDYREGDILQCFKIVEKKAPIDWGT